MNILKIIESYTLNGLNYILRKMLLFFKPMIKYLKRRKKKVMILPSKSI